MANDAPVPTALGCTWCTYWVPIREFDLDAIVDELGAHVKRVHSNRHGDYPTLDGGRVRIIYGPLDPAGPPAELTGWALYEAGLDKFEREMLAVAAAAAGTTPEALMRRVIQKQVDQGADLWGADMLGIVASGSGPAGDGRQA